MNMTDSWRDKWDERFRDEEYVYGTEPNRFLKEQLQKLKPGHILFGAEGEGRNAVYAAKLGWTVSAFDISIEGKNKALKLAKENDVSIAYQVGQLPDLDFENDQFDAIALIYAHFPLDVRSRYHALLNNYLKKGGRIIFEAFGKNHPEYQKKYQNIGGPRESELLFSTEDLKSDFSNYEILKLAEEEAELSEGLHHRGKGSVVRFIGEKK